MSLLEVRNLSVTFDTMDGPVMAVDHVDFDIGTGEMLHVVGESGSGKSLSLLAVMGLVPSPGRVVAEAIRFDGVDLQTLPARQRRRIVGRDISMVFQDPRSSLNPCFPVGWQIAEALRLHKVVPKSKIRLAVVGLMRSVGIAEPESRYGAYPHQLSGGMNQRVMIALAIACRPKLLIADEPTSALDVTVQRQVLALLDDLRREHGMALALVTHDMGIVARAQGRVRVMYAGKVVEEGAGHLVLHDPRHPYTAALLSSRPDRDRVDGRLDTIPGTVPGIGDRPDGCLFEPRCRGRQPLCAADRPRLDGALERRWRCHFPLPQPALDRAFSRGDR